MSEVTSTGTFEAICPHCQAVGSASYEIYDEMECKMVFECPNDHVEYVESTTGLMDFKYEHKQ